jgi:hypothetical protein
MQRPAAAELPPPEIKGHWGNYYWGVLHLAAYHLDPEPSDAARQAFLNLVNSYVHLLPCPRCRHHFAELLASNPPDVHTTRDALYKWTIDAHNTANAHAGKSQWKPGGAAWQPLFWGAGLVVAFIIVWFLYGQWRRHRNPHRGIAV